MPYVSVDIPSTVHDRNMSTPSSILLLEDQEICTPPPQEDRDMCKPSPVLLLEYREICTPSCRENETTHTSSSI